MRIGIVGLGKMGGNIARRLKREGHECVTYDANAEVAAKLASEGMTGADSLADMLDRIGGERRAIWLMLPAGRITEEAICDLSNLMRAGDIVIDGGNTYYKDDVRRAGFLREKGIEYVDVGTSGGVWGLERGYCMMIGGSKSTVDHLDPIFGVLAPGLGDIERTPGREGRDPRVERGYLHAGPVGAGHFVKMIHNGIEYGMMQAYAEGFDILKNKNSDVLPSEKRYDLNVGDIAEVWRRGSVVSSWLLDLAASALTKDGHLEGFTGYVDDSGEGRWTIEAAIEEAVPADVLSSALYVRFRSRQQSTFAEKVLSAMRMGFGGHVEGKGPSDAAGHPAETHGHADTASRTNQGHG